MYLSSACLRVEFNCKSGITSYIAKCCFHVAEEITTEAPVSIVV